MEAAARAEADVKIERGDDGTLTLIVPGGPEAVAARIASLAKSGARIASATPQGADLASLFSRLAGGKQ